MVEYSGSYMYICLHICIYILVFIYVYTNGRVLRYVYVYLSSYLCTQLVQCFAICLPMERAQLYTTPDFSMDIQGCWAIRLAASVAGKGDHNCLWAAVIYFWSLLWCLQHSPVIVFLSSNHTSGTVIGWLGDKFPIFLGI